VFKTGNTRVAVCFSGRRLVATEINDSAQFLERRWRGQAESERSNSSPRRIHSWDHSCRPVVAVLVERED